MLRNASSSFEANGLVCPISCASFPLTNPYYSTSRYLSRGNLDTKQYGAVIMAVMAREKLSPEARALLEEIDSLGLPALQSLAPAAARVQVRESSKRSI